MNTLHERIAYTRRLNGKTQAEQADMFHLSISYISDVERGSKKANLKLLKGIAKHYPATNFNWLFYGDGLRQRDTQPLKQMNNPAWIIELFEILDKHCNSKELKTEVLEYLQQ